MTKRPLLVGVFELKFSKFQTWIGFFSTIFEQNQKTRKLCTFVWSLSELILIKIRAHFLEKKASPCWCFWTKIFQISNLNRIFFHHFWAKSENPKIPHIYFLWTSCDKIFSEKKILQNFWNFPNFPTWNRIFFHIFWAKSENSKISQI